MHGTKIKAKIYIVLCFRYVMLQHSADNVDSVCTGNRGILSLRCGGGNEVSASLKNYPVS
jgi:hypothetical protein